MNRKDLERLVDEQLAQLRSAEARAVMAEEVPCDEGEDPFLVGGCLTWATAAQQALGPAAEVWTLVVGDEEYGHAVVRHGGRFYDASGSYRTAKDVLRAYPAAGARLVRRDVFLAEHPERGGLVLHEGSVPRIARLAGEQMVLPVIHKRAVYHVGDLNDTPRRRDTSYEGRGLSVSEVPHAWAQIAHLGGEPYELRRRDGKPGVFVDLTTAKTNALVPMAVAAGYLKPTKGCRLSFLDTETDERVYQMFASEAEARAEIDDPDDERDFKVEMVDTYAATPKLQREWRKDFTGAIPDPVSIGVLYAVEAMAQSATKPRLDGSWWNETLDVDQLSAPRGVIFKKKLPEWSARQVGWADVPDEQRT